MSDFLEKSDTNMFLYCTVQRYEGVGGCQIHLNGPIYVKIFLATG